MKPETLQILESQVIKIQSVCRVGRETWPLPLLEEMTRVSDEILKAIEIEKGPSTLELECYEKGDRIKRLIESSKKYG